MISVESLVFLSLRREGVKNMDVIQMPLMIDWIIVIVFLIAVLGVGFAFRNRASKDVKSFWLAGKRIGLALSTSTVMATWFGVDVTIGFAENGFRMGLAAGLFWIVPYYAVRIPFFLWIPVVRRILPDDVNTISDFMEFLYGGTGFWGRLGSFLAAFLTAARCGHASHFLGMGLLLSHLTGWNPVLLTVIIAFITGVYTTLGGMYGVTVTDFMQFVVMTMTIGICIPNALDSIGGWQGIYASVADPSFFTWSGGNTISYLVMWNLVAVSLYVDPTFYQRFQAAKDTPTATLAYLLCLPLWITFAICAVMVGIIGKAMFPELLAYQAVVNVYLGFLPPVLTGFWLCGFFAAGMSSQDSIMLIFGTTIGKDIYQKFINPKATQKQILNIAKFSILIWSPLAGYIYSSGFSAVIDVWKFIASFYGAALLIPITVGFMWTGRKTSASGALSLLGGICTYLLWEYALGVPFGIPTLLVSWLVSLIMFLIGNHIGPQVYAPWHSEEHRIEQEVN